MKKLIVFLFLQFFNLNCFSQIITFEKSYPYFNNEDEQAMQVLQTLDKGYAISVTTIASGLFSLRYGGILKTDSLGHKLWEYRFVIPQYASFEYITESKDSGIIFGMLIPTDTSGVGNYNIRINKLNSTGQYQWSCLINAQFAISKINSILIGKKNKILISCGGFGNSDLISLDSIGYLLKWTHYPNQHSVAEILPIKDSLFKGIAAFDTMGQYKSLGYVTFNDSGIIINTTMLQYYPDSVIVGTGGACGTLSKKGEGFFLGQKRNLLGNWEVLYFFKFDSVGTMIINRKSNFDYTHLGQLAMTPTNDGGFIMAGGILNNNGSLGYSWLYRFDENGDSLWFKYIANAWNKVAYFGDVVQTVDTGFIAAGSIKPSSWQEPYLVKTDPNGQVFNLLAIKNETVAADDLTLYPNPAKTLLNVYCTGINGNSLFEIRDLSGKLILQETMNNHPSKDARFQIDLTALSPGFYLFQLIAEGRVVTSKKLVVTE